MRASPQEQTGGAGVSEVAAAFQRLGWGVVENARHDLGTDLFVMARDERRLDLGLIVGVQVKAGSSYFREPYVQAGQPLGWWYRDRDRRHVDSWLGHGVPHLLVLHDLNSRTSYWAHVTADSVVSTGKGARILVRRTSTVDASHRAPLLAVAATLRSATSLEGSVWPGGERAASADTFRHALVVPRLVAPHPNAGWDEPIVPVQGVALLSQARFRDYEHFAERHRRVPRLKTAMRSKVWGWRFAGALGRRMLTGGSSPLSRVLDEAPDPASRAAASVVLAANHLEDGVPEEAISTLEKALVTKNLLSSDTGWLQGQLARALAEVGRLDEARELTAQLQKLPMHAPGDLTATAIAGCAASLLFHTSTWGERDVKGLIRGVDTTVSWWRTRTTSRGLGALARRIYNDWSRDSSVTVGADDVSRNQLFVAALSASHLGDHDAWRHLSGLLGQDLLMRVNPGEDLEAAADALSTLRSSGNDKELRLGVRQLVANGPAQAVTRALAKIDLEKSTRTTGLSNLRLIEAGGDVADRDTADRAVSFVIDTLADPEGFAMRTTPSYFLPVQLVEALASIAPAASTEEQRRVLDLALSLKDQHELLERAWRRVIWSLEDRIWDRDVVQLARRRAKTAGTSMRLTLLGRAATFGQSAAKKTLQREAGAGSLAALAELGSVRELPQDMAAGSIEAAATQARKTIDSARAGSYSFGVHDVGQTLAVLNAWHPEVAKWGPLLDLLEEPTVAPMDKGQALSALATLVEKLPEPACERLKRLATSLIDDPPVGPVSPFQAEPDVRGPAIEIAIALEGFDEAAAIDHWLQQLDSGPLGRQRATRIAHRVATPEAVGILVALAKDQDPDVRAASLAGITSLVAAGDQRAMLAGAISRGVSDPGTQVPWAIASSLAAAPSIATGAQAIVPALRSSCSARVRQVAHSIVV